MSTHSGPAPQFIPSLLEATLSDGVGEGVFGWWAEVVVGELLEGIGGYDLLSSLWALLGKHGLRAHKVSI